MKNAIASIEGYESLLDRRERELISQRERVWLFLNKDHTSPDIRKYLVLIRKSEIGLGRIQRKLMDDHDAASQVRGEMKALCERIRTLGVYTKSMDDALCHDLLEKRLIEDGERIDLLKNVTFLLAVPVTLMNMVKDGVFG